MEKEQIDNLFSLIKDTLEFYGDKKNYEVNHPLNNELFSKIEMDKGAFARKTLGLMKKINNFDNELKNIDDKLLEKLNMDSVDDPQEMLKFIDNLTKKYKK